MPRDAMLVRFAHPKNVSEQPESSGAVDSAAREAGARVGIVEGGSLCEQARDCIVAAPSCSAQEEPVCPHARSRRVGLPAPDSTRRARTSRTAPTFAPRQAGASLPRAMGGGSHTSPTARSV